MIDPTTPEEWQVAVNIAAFWLLVDSAEKYGLVEVGDEVIDVERCEEILRRGAELGVLPVEWAR